uniref:C-factor-like n=1 Tax=Meleagris gallopavo TaxID=9103 RepID=A0A803YAV8_MELGA
MLLLPLPQAFLPLLKKAAQGSPGSGMSCSKAAIVNISSTAGSIKEVYLWESEQCLSYRCSKAAQNMLTRCQSMGYREHGILCIAFHPGWVQTDMGNSVGEKVGASPRWVHPQPVLVSHGRLLSPEALPQDPLRGPLPQHHGSSPCPGTPAQRQPWLPAAPTARLPSSHPPARALLPPRPQPLPSRSRAPGHS